MQGKTRIKKIVRCALKASKAEQTEVVVFNNIQALTRFANNHIHQNVNEANSIVSVRVAFGKKIGFASTNSFNPKKIRETVHWAEDIARYQRENDGFRSLPFTKKKHRTVATFVKRTSQFSHKDRAKAVADIVRVAKKYKYITYGSVSNGTAEIGIGNSLGTYKYAVCDDVFCNIVMSAQNSTGYVQAGNRDVNKINFTALAETAAQKAFMSVDPVEVPPGRYTTIFEPLAASEFFEYLGYYGFNGRLYEEGRSFLTGKLGTKIVDDRISIYDNPFDTTAYAFPFDFEGMPKKKLSLVSKGIAKRVVYDSLTASKFGKTNTSHALTAPNPFGPVPMHITVKSGNTTLQDMIAKTKRGILVTRFHYTNIIDPYKLTFTGMTRDGTFLIQNGAITNGLKNLRFTENIINCLNRIDAVSKQTFLVPSEPGYGGRFGIGLKTPVLKIKNFTFTSATEF